MACMEYRCTNGRCHWRAMNNDIGPEICPLCGARVISFFDEEFDEPGNCTVLQVY